MKRSHVIGTLTAGGLVAAAAGWQAREARNRERRALSAAWYAPTKLARVDPATPDTVWLRLQLPCGLAPEEHRAVLHDSDSLFYVSVKEPFIQTQRPYTPLHLREDSLDLLVKRYEDGVVSRWLHRCRPGDELDVRGPIAHWSLKNPAADGRDIVYAAGGTGIAPLAQLLSRHLGSATDDGVRRFHVVYACRDRQHCALLDELHALQHSYPGRIDLTLHFDTAEEGRWTRLLRTSNATAHAGGFMPVGLVTQAIHRAQKHRDGASPVVLLCGPDGFVDHVQRGLPAPERSLVYKL